MPVLLQKLGKLKSRVRNRRTAKKTAEPKKKKNTEVYIDSPQRTKRRFNKAARLHKKNEQTKLDASSQTKQKIRTRTLQLGTHKRKFYIGGALVAVGIVGVVTLSTTNGKKQGESKGEVAGASTEVAKPTFTPLATGNEVRQKVKFDTTREVASYEDKIGGVRVVVSQQKLAEKDRVDPNFLSRTATAFNLKTDMTTKKGQAFSGVNIEKNTQFTMFVYKDFLVFIQGDESVKNQLIVDYIDSLE